eukprot:2599004-Rhodomonas_salina.1
MQPPAIAPLLFPLTPASSFLLLAHLLTCRLLSLVSRLSAPGGREAGRAEDGKQSEGRYGAIDSSSRGQTQRESTVRSSDQSQSSTLLTPSAAASVLQTTSPPPHLTLPLNTLL